jgi:hypothetical protein
VGVWALLVLSICPAAWATAFSMQPSYHQTADVTPPDMLFWVVQLFSGVGSRVVQSCYLHISSVEDEAAGTSGFTTAGVWVLLGACIVHSIIWQVSQACGYDDC